MSLILNSSRQKIQFGINMRVGCVFEKTRDQLSKNCAYFRKQIFDILSGNAHSKRSKRQNSVAFEGMDLLLRQRVAIFGNSKITQPQDWIPVLMTNLPDLSTLQNSEIFAGECRDVIRSLHIEIYYANVGSFANPQAKILGVNYIWALPEDIIFRCNGLKCRLANASQQIEVSTSVGFVDLTQPALAYFKEKPVIEAKLPHDFFYPFVKDYKPAKSTAAKIRPFILYIHFVCFFVLSQIQ